MRYGPFYKKIVVEDRRSGLRIRVRHGKGRMFSRGISKGIGDMPSEFCGMYFVKTCKKNKRFGPFCSIDMPFRQRCQADFSI